MTVKPLNEMSRYELEAECERWSGIPVPQGELSAEERAQWFVAHIFGAVLKLAEPHELRAAMAGAASIVIDCAAWHDRPEYRSSLEGVIGRPITAAELEAREIQPGDLKMDPARERALMAALQKAQGKGAPLSAAELLS